MMYHKCGSRRIAIISRNGQFSAFPKYNCLTLILHCHILNYNKLPSVLFSVSVVHDPATKEESFLKDINMKQMDPHFHF